MQKTKEQDLEETFPKPNKSWLLPEAHLMSSHLSLRSRYGASLGVHSGRRSWGSLASAGKLQKVPWTSQGPEGSLRSCGSNKGYPNKNPSSKRKMNENPRF